MVNDDFSQLIILGNGFDISCGLPSRYSDFYKTRPAVAEIFNCACQAKANVNIWDVILGSSKGKQENWAGIEDAIKEWVMTSHDIGAPAMPVEKVAYYLARDDFSVYPECSVIKELDSEYPVAYYLKLKFLNSDERIMNWRSYISRILDIFLDQLEKYEKIFQDYLGDVLQLRNDDYRYRASRRVSSLISYGVSDLSLELIQKTSILSFNFTLPFYNSPIADVGISSLQDEFDVCQNVHGTLAVENSFFGIDGKDLMDNEDFLPFTKTYRIINEQNKRYSCVLGKRNFSIIKIFGHSMCESDYSYFQAVFDDVDLYHSHTKIIAFYSEDIPDDKTVQTKRLVRLLSVYGSTLDNRDHGKNLIHKMVLEGRIEIACLS
ncbi:hypothetical protein BSD967_07735 [Bifidobacterium saguini]|nr:AbiH family protein [Bifidobacterium saguini]QTB90235.1 hypothetical protein BSD967_07735 [Bifidobacterium saguini]